VRIFWPPGEPAQVDYESLRAAVLFGTPLGTPAALRFARQGLRSVIAHPVAEEVFSGVLIGAVRPPFTPHADPRLELLAASYTLLLEAAGSGEETRAEEETK